MSYPIKPSDIDTMKGFGIDIFGGWKKASPANCLVRFAQENDSWRNFTRAEIDEFNDEAFSFEGLDQGAHPMIMTNADGSFSFTHEFIARCFLSSPAHTDPLA